MDDQEFKKKLDEYLRQYEELIENSKLMDNAKKTYLLHSRNFVRWVNEDFIPGDTLE